MSDVLDNAYRDPVKEFSRGKRFRSSNDPYFKLLRCVAGQNSSVVDLSDLANQYPEVKGSINNIKEKRLAILLDTKPSLERYFYYNSSTKNFAIEDPALFYYLRHVNWETLREECGFRHVEKDYEFDFAISFAGENRNLAELLSKQLIDCDCSVFFDKLYEANYLGKTWSKKFTEIFRDDSRYVVCFLDKHYAEKIWPTFERECFMPRVEEGEVIPIYLDDTSFVGIPKDVVGIDLKKVTGESSDNFMADNVTFKLLEFIESI